MGTELLQQGFDLMLFGMGTVFVFLALLVVGTIAMSNIIARFFPEPAKEEPVISPSSNVDASQQITPKTLKIIQEAILLHRSR